MTLIIRAEQKKKKKLRYGKKWLKKTARMARLGEGD